MNEIDRTRAIGKPWAWRRRPGLAIVEPKPNCYPAQA
jgi:hypothetical protein